MNTKTSATLSDAFHEAALEPEAWHDALTRLGEMVGGSGVVVVTAYDPLGGARLLKSIGYNPEYWDRVQAEHGTPKTNRYINLMNSAPPGQVLQPRASMSLSEWLDDPIYRKFLRPDGLADGLACPLFHAGDGFAAVATFRSRHYDPRHLRLLQAAAPHIRHALHVHLRLDAHAAAAREGLAALDKLKAGILLTDAQARVIFANAAAQGILRKSDGILVGRGGLLLAARPDETSRLRALVKSAAEAALRSGRQAGREEGRAAAGGSVRLSRPSDREPFDVLVTPLWTAMLPGSLAVHRHASVMLLVADLDEGVGIEPAALCQMYGLTAAEARLTLQLLLGRDLPTAATALGISIHTAKTLLKRAFIRTGTNRQSELVGTILRGPLGAVRDGACPG